MGIPAPTRENLCLSYRARRGNRSRSPRSRSQSPSHRSAPKMTGKVPRPPGAVTHMVLVQDWTAELERRVPVN